MERYNFEQFLATLEAYFPILDESLNSIYFDSLKRFSPAYCLEASKILFESCKKAYFPSLAEIVEAFTEAYNNAPHAHIEEIKDICPECENEGLIIKTNDKNQSYAVYCQCQKGKENFEAHGRYFEKYHLFNWKEKQTWEAYKKKRRIK